MLISGTIAETTSDFAIALNAGLHSVTVTDAKGC